MPEKDTAQDIKPAQETQQQAHRLSFMEAPGIREGELIHDLADMGFNPKTFALLQLVPFVQVAWVDGEVSDKERDLVLDIASLRGVSKGSVAHDLLATWLTQPPSARFFRTCLAGIRAVLRHRSPREATALRRELIWYATRVAGASGGFLGLGSRISDKERSLLTQLDIELEVHPPRYPRARIEAPVVCGAGRRTLLVPACDSAVRATVSAWVTRLCRQVSRGRTG